MHPLQSKEWGKARQQMGIETVRFSDGKESFLVTLHKVPLINYKIGYLPRSPMPSKSILDQIYDFGRKNKVLFVKIEPYVILRAKLEGSPTNVGIAHSGEILRLVQNDKRLIKSPHPLFPDWTQVLDLTKSEEELLKTFHPKTRYNIRLAQKKGVIVKEESDNKGFEIFSKLYFETTKRQKYHGHDYSYHKIVWNSLKDKIAHILIAYYEGLPLAAYQLWYLDGVIYYVYGGTSIEHRNLMASNLLMWEAIKLGKRLGAKRFDMWGSLPPDYDPTHPWSGFTRFKEGYGTEYVEFVGSFDLIINPILYKIYNIVYVLRDIFLRFKIFAT